MDKARSIPRLGELEAQVLEHLWRVGEADVQAAHAALGVPRGITLNTVGSALERLHKKELVVREKISHAYRYRPVMDRASFMAQAMVNAAGGLKALGEQGLLTAFIDVITDASEETLDELERLVRMKKAQRQ